MVNVVQLYYTYIIIIDYIPLPVDNKCDNVNYHIPLPVDNKCDNVYYIPPPVDNRCDNVNEPQERRQDPVQPGKLQQLDRACMK